MLLFLEIQTDTTSIWMHWTKDGLDYLTWPCQKNIYIYSYLFIYLFILGYYWANGTIRWILWKTIGPHTNIFTWPFYTQKLLHFSHNKKERGKTDDTYDRICRMWTIFNKLDDSYAIYYSPTVQLAVEKNYCALQRENHFQTIYIKWTHKVWHHILLTLWF